MIGERLLPKEDLVLTEETLSDGIALFSAQHPPAMREMLLDDRTIGEIMMAKEKPSLLFKMLNLFKKL